MFSDYSSDQIILTRPREDNFHVFSCVFAVAKGELYVACYSETNVNLDIT